MEIRQVTKLEDLGGLNPEEAMQVHFLTRDCRGLPTIHSYQGLFYQKNSRGFSMIQWTTEEMDDVMHKVDYQWSPLAKVFFSPRVDLRHRFSERDYQRYEQSLNQIDVEVAELTTN